MYGPALGASSDQQHISMRMTAVIQHSLVACAACVLPAASQAWQAGLPRQQLTWCPLHRASHSAGATTWKTVSWAPFIARCCSRTET